MRTAVLAAAFASTALAGPLSRREADDTTVVAGPKRPVPGGYDYIGCYPGMTYGQRTVHNLLNDNSPTWDIERCVTEAGSKGYAVAGITYGGECWGSNTVPSISTLQADSTCQKPCNDDPENQICGGEKNIDVYVAKTTDKLINDANWSYRGCYLDNIEGMGRTLPNLKNVGGKWTVSDCLAAVKAARLSVGGLEYGGECWGGVEIANYAVAAGKQPVATCSKPCNDNAQLSCGGTNALDIYVLKTSSTKLWSDADWTYKGCYTDAGNGNARTLTDLISEKDARWTVQTCLDAATALNYGYAGLIYGGECWGGNEIAAGGPTSSSRCAWQCNDADPYTCGGESAMDIYTAVIPTPAVFE
ncbi:hypothetical protein JCM8547_006820 [Rhodosporidiobolus lusitaniae]